MSHWHWFGNVNRPAREMTLWSVTSHCTTSMIETFTLLSIPLYSLANIRQLVLVVVVRRSPTSPQIACTSILPVSPNGRRRKGFLTALTFLLRLHCTWTCTGVRNGSVSTELGSLSCAMLQFSPACACSVLKDFPLKLTWALIPSPRTLSDGSINRALVCSHMHFGLNRSWYLCLRRAGNKKHTQHAQSTKTECDCL